jgi:hypothetical protein
MSDIAAPIASEGVAAKSGLIQSTDYCGQMPISFNWEGNYLHRKPRNSAEVDSALQIFSTTKILPVGKM